LKITWIVLAAVCLQDISVETLQSEWLFTAALRSERKIAENQRMTMPMSESNHSGIIRRKDEKRERL